MLFAIEKKAQHIRNRSNVLKTMLFTINNCSQRAAEAEQNSQLEGLALRMHVFTHTHSFASPARTARTKRKRKRNEADLPVAGRSDRPD